MRAWLRGGGGLVRAWAAFAGRRIGLLTWTAPTLALEMWIIGPLFIWAVVLGAPGNTLMTTASFRLLAAWGLNGTLISLVCGGVAGFQGWAVLADNLRWRVWAAIAGWCVWTFLGLTLILAVPLGTGGWVYLWQAIGEGWVFARLVRGRPRWNQH